MARFQTVLLFVLSVVIAAFAYPQQLNYNIGDQLQFNLHANVDSRGNSAVSGATTSGAFSTMDSTMVIQCTDKNATAYMFVMNMFNTVVNVGQNSVGERIGTGDDNALGPDMYFVQFVDGTIPEMWYQDGDSPYFVNVKVGGINSLQTHIVQPGDSLRPLESDPVGVHYSAYLGDAGSETSLLVNKTFTQHDFTAFPDPNLRAQNMEISGATSTRVHAQGYILGATVDQYSTFVNAAPAGVEAAAPHKASDDPNDGWNLQFQSHGVLTIDMIQLTRNGKLFAGKRHTFSSVHGDADLKSTTMFGWAAHAVQISQNELPAVDLEAALAAFAAPVDNSKVYTLLDKLVRVLAQPRAVSDRVWHMVQPLLSQMSIGVLSPQQRSRLLYVLAQTGTTKSEQQLREHGFGSQDIYTRLHAVFAASTCRAPSRVLLALLAAMASTDANAHTVVDLRRAATLALGAAMSNSIDLYAVQSARDALVDELHVAMQNNDLERVRTVLHAVANAGDKMTVQHLTRDVVQFVRRHTALAKSFARIVGASRLAGLSLPTVSAANDFPFNVSWGRALDLGGKIAYVDFTVNTFAGTNFDCNQQYFDYEGSAIAQATAGLLAYSKQAFVAEVIYGKDAGAPLANEILLQVWNTVLYDQALPQLDCNLHQYPLYHAAPGFSVAYTLWVSVIPLTFRAGTTLQINVQWGWQICDTQLSAMIQVSPAATVVMTGGAEIDLLIIRAETDLDFSFNTALVPQAYIHGSQCAVGMDVELQQQPMTGDFHSYYMWRHCKYWIFDCSWGPQNDHTWWSWSSPAHTETLFHQDFKIQA
eukprot:TRINITY_DN5867_c0_g1_i1.p1 TRINITY_DN5867_c0_g1~~TRINITY_DN5867_c0_g1_i1.p1  ORF type:complete len:831 (+),score=243.55 TRINITY_DN5867_c0_g1_i1:54-2495(+)